MLGTRTKLGALILGLIGPIGIVPHLVGAQAHDLTGATGPAVMGSYDGFGVRGYLLDGVITLNGVVEGLPVGQTYHCGMNPTYTGDRFVGTMGCEYLYGKGPLVGFPLQFTVNVTSGTLAATDWSLSGTTTSSPTSETAMTGHTLACTGTIVDNPVWGWDQMPGACTLD